MKKALLLPFIFLLFTGYIHAVKHTSVKGFRAKSYNSHTRVVVDMDGAVEITQNRLANPDRIYFDLKNCVLSGRPSSSISMEDGVLKKVRASQFNKDTVRIVLDVGRSGNYYAFMLENPHRLVIDVHASGSDVSPPMKEDRAVKRDIDRKTRIVIDPGHGGEDPGAIGPGGLMEKDVVLSVGKRLGSILAEKPGVEIIYTRDKDVFIPLNERTEIANSKKADLFISVHANASPRKNTRGIETYFLNWTNDKDALRVAARENKISFRKMEQMQGDLQMILEDLARKNKNEESMKLASTVQNAMVSALKESYSGVEDLGVKYAMFYVLVGAEMPSVLVEIAFISNREEEKRLASEKYRNKIAGAIASGIDSYMTRSTLVAGRTGEAP
ncbi:MAG: N-acetylmuramoyl-L-alanine amidase [Nitrospiraceae bacterium]|nr:MAG: N-acetylmuramoyl-L-alanine amidase [Nitrospiraceae bacterium]